MAKRKTAQDSERQKIVRKALQVTWQLKGQLKVARMAYLRIGATLIRVRDEKIFADLGHADLEEYAEKRLKLCRASLYRYLNTYEWVKGSHPEWLAKKPKGFIPDLSDAGSLMWIEERLKASDLSPEDRAQLESLRKKALAGELRQSELAEFRKKGKKVDSLRAYLNKFRSFRTRCARIVGMPPEVVRCLDDAIELLQNHQEVAKCVFDGSDAGERHRLR